MSKNKYEFRGIGRGRTSDLAACSRIFYQLNYDTRGRLLCSRYYMSLIPLGDSRSQSAI